MAVAELLQFDDRLKIECSTGREVKRCLAILVTVTMASLESARSGLHESATAMTHPMAGFLGLV